MVAFTQFTTKLARSVLIMVNGLRIEAKAPTARMLPSPAVVSSNDTVYILTFEIHLMLMDGDASKDITVPVSQRTSGVMGSFTQLNDAKLAGTAWLDTQQAKYVPDPSKADPDPWDHWTRADWRGTHDGYSAVLLDIYGSNRMIVRIEPRKLQYLVSDDSMGLATEQYEELESASNDEDLGDNMDEDSDDTVSIEGKDDDEFQTPMKKGQVEGKRKRALEGISGERVEGNAAKKARTGDRTTLQSQSLVHSGPITPEQEGPAFRTRSGVAKTPEPEGPAFHTRSGVANTPESEGPAFPTRSGAPKTVERKGPAFRTQSAVVKIPEPERPAFHTRSGVTNTLEAEGPAFHTRFGAPKTVEREGPAFRTRSGGTK